MHWNQVFYCFVGSLFLAGFGFACQEGTLCQDAEGNQGYCLTGVCMATVPEYERQNLTLQINVLYPEQNIQTGNIFIRGSGLGLNWEAGIPMTKVGNDAWEATFVFKSTKTGFTCHFCEDQTILKLGEHLHYRLLINDTVDMQGGDFVVDLPASKAALRQPRQVFAYPWFLEKTGTLTNFSVASSYLNSERNLSFYLPPSYKENPYKNYGVLLALDFNPSLMEFLRSDIFDEFAYGGLMAETIIIGWGDYVFDERTLLLTPSVGVLFECLNGTFANQCNNCYPPEYEINSPEWLEAMKDRCGYPASSGGNGEATLNFLIKEVIPKVEELSNYRLLKDRETTGIMGYSLGGLMSCHAMWTRNEVFGYAACQSSSFWWPLQPDAGAGFEFLNSTMKNPEFLKARKPQRVYVDVGDGYNEISPPFFMDTAAIEVVDSFVQTGHFKLDENVWFQLYPTHTHSVLNWLTRIWSPLSVLIPPEGFRTGINTLNNEDVQKN